MLGRIAETAVLVRLLRDAVSGRGGALCVAGEPGAGRTTLLHSALTLDPAPRPVLVTGTEAESGLRHAGLHQVVRAHRATLPHLPVPQRDLLERLLAGAAHGPGDGGLALGAALLGLLAAAAAVRPLLLAVDDAHLLDPPSLEALLFAARRLTDEPVALLLTVEADGRGAPPALRPAATGVPELRLGPLDPADARALLGRSTPRPLARHVADRVLAVAEGNPLALTELPAALTPAQCAGTQLLDDPLVPGERLRDAHLPRLARLPHPTRDALLVPATAGDLPADRLQRALALVGHAPDALLPAEEEGVIDVRAGRVTFADRRLRLVAHHDARPSRRRGVHHALAQVLDGPGAARHRALAAAPGPDAELARAVQGAAGGAERTDPDLAAELYERAAEFADDRDHAARLLCLAAHLRQRAGAEEAVPHLLGRATALAGGPELRRELAVIQARRRGTTAHPRTAHRALRDAAGQLTVREPDRAARLLLESVGPAVHAADSRAALGSAWQAYRLTRLCGSDLAEAAAVRLAQVLALRGERGQARELLLTQTAGETPGVLVGRAEVLGWLEEYEAAFVLLDRVLVPEEFPVPQAGGGAEGRAGALGCRAWIRLWTGDWQGARADATETVALAEQRRDPACLAQGLVALARLEAAQGRVAQCRAVLSRAAAVARAHGLELVRGQIAVAEGLLALGAGKYRDAVAGYERAGALARDAGIEDPSVAPWAANLVEAYLRGGRVAEAAAQHARFDSEMRRAGPSWALAVSARCRAQLLDADGTGTPGAVEAAYHEALEWHARGAAVFEQARTLLCHGQWLRRAGRTSQARTSLDEARAVFAALGAVPWAEATDSELRATGTCPGRTRLTDQETRIAGLVAGGATNKETAAALFLSTKTVEFHLGNVYRKLGVRSRSELARSYDRAPRHGEGN